MGKKAKRKLFFGGKQVDSWAEGIAYVMEERRKEQLANSNIMLAEALKGSRLPEPKQAAQEPQQDKLKYYCQKAIDKGYMVRDGAGYKKTEKWTKAQLAYFLGHFLNDDGTFPDTKYSMMFGESRLSKARSQLIDNKHGGGKPKGYEEVDELLQE